jgi:hypothetical protein
MLSLVCLSVLALQLVAAQSITPAAPAASNTLNANPVSAEELQRLRDQIAAQAEQIKKLQQSIEEQRTLLNGVLQPASAPAATNNTSPTATAANTAPVTNANAAPAGNQPVQLVPVSNVANPAKITPSGRMGQHNLTVNPSPLSISIGNTTFTPLGFVDFTFFNRSTNVGSGIGTSFGGIPYNNTTKGRISEGNLSTQNSRIGFRVDSTFLGAKVLGYFEADFLGNQPSTVFVTSNSDTFRMRNVFVDVQKNGLEILGGQDWSLATPNRKGLSPLPSDIFYTQNMDTNYQAGLVWARQSQFRVIAHPNDDLAFGVSIENPEQYVNGYITFPSALASSLGGGNQLNDNSSGNGYQIPNLHPDIIFKAAYDAHAGEKILHVEAGALIRTFKVVLPTTYVSHSATAYSGEVNANLEVVKNFRIIANTFFGSGNGRYIMGLGPDVVVRADGSLSPVHSYSTVDGFETNVGKNTVISMLYGGAYFSRNTAVDLNGSLIGFGYPGSPNAQNRNVQEATFDVVRTLWKNPNYGALSLIGQYSYVWRDPWTVVAGQRNARTNMYYIDLRYTIP